MDAAAAAKRERSEAWNNIRRLRQKRKRLERMGRGCGWGCLAAVVLFFAVPTLVSRLYAKWSDVRPFLAAVQPGMAVEEVLSLVPKRFETFQRKEDAFFEGASVAAPGARPDSVLVVRVKEASTVSRTLGFLAGVADAAWVYFDAAGKVVGEDYSACSAGKAGKWKRNRPWGVPFGEEP